MDRAPFQALPARGYRIDAALRALSPRGVLAISSLSPRDVVGHVSSGSFEPGERVSLRIVGAPIEIGPLSGVVEAAEHDGADGDALVHVSLDASTLSEGRAVLALLETLRASGELLLPAPERVATEVVRDPKRVVAIMRQIFELRCETRFEEPDALGGGTAGRWAQPSALVPGSALPLVWNVAPPCPRPPFDVQVVWMNWEFCFRVERAEHDGGRVRTALPTEIVRVRDRFQRRAPAPHGASVSFQHPLWPTLTVSQPLHDVSLNGASFATNLVEDGVFLGLELPVLEIAWPSGELSRFRATVRRVAASPRRGAMVAGVSLVPLSDDDARVWRDIVDREFYRHTSLGDAHGEPMWELFDRSGYFNLSGKNTQEFSELRGAFQRVTSTLARPNDVAVHVVLASGGSAHSSVTMVKPYEHSWLTCQIARRPDTRPHALTERRVLLETMLHGFEHPLGDPGFRWFVSWVQAEARWSRWLLYELAQRYTSNPDEACVLRFRAMEGRTEEQAGATPLGAYEVAPAREDEIERLLDAVAATRPLSYREAHDLVRERVDIRTVGDRWRALGLVRGRHLLVAREGGVAVAAGVLDLVEDGVHLFGLLDVLRTFALEPGGERAFGAILEAARAWYRAQGKHKFAYFVEHDDYEHAQRAGLKDLGAADLVVISARYMPDQLEHIWEITAPRDRPSLREASVSATAGAVSG